jgi:hypothetical protein
MYAAIDKFRVKVANDFGFGLRQSAQVQDIGDYFDALFA